MRPLTKRQKEIVTLLGHGLSQQEAARQLGIKYGYARQLVMLARERQECRSTVQLVARHARTHD